MNLENHKEMNDSRSSAQILLFFLSRHWRPFAFIALLSVLVAALNGLNMAMLFPMVNLILGVQANTTLEQSWVMEWAQHVISLFPGGLPIIIIGILLITFNFVQLLVNLLTQFLIARQNKIIMSSYRSLVYETYQGASLAYILDQKAGDLLYNITIPPGKVAKVLLHISEMIFDGLEVLVLIGILISLNPLQTSVFIIVAAVGYFFLTRFTNRLFYNYSVVSRNVSSDINSLFSEFIVGFKQIKIGNTQSVWRSRFESLNIRFANVYKDSRFHSSIPSPTIRFIILLLLISTVIILKVIAPTDFANNLAFLGVAGLAFLRISNAMVRLNQYPIQISNSLADVERMHEVIHLKVATPVSGDIPVPPLQKSIAFKDLSFAYSDRKLLFDRLNLSFNKGLFSAVVGLSGSGKSTLFNLLLGLYKPESGYVLVDGVDICDIDLTTWYEQIGYVSQDVVLFHASVLENIRNFNPRFSESEVEKAARLSLAHDFIIELPQGYHTIIGERGMRLSGGQQQRLAIARAVVHNPDILLFDEATSALDTASERLVQEAIYAASKGRTVIAIAHRLSTIVNADKIFVLDQGRIVEQGQHAELIAKNGEYARLALMQEGKKVSTQKVDMSD